MTEFKAILFIIEKDFTQSKHVEIFFKSKSGEHALNYLHNTISKSFNIVQLEKIGE